MQENGLRLIIINLLKKVDLTLHYYRYRIRDPKMFRSFITKEVTPGIKFVFGIS